MKRNPTVWTRTYYLRRKEEQADQSTKERKEGPDKTTLLYTTTTATPHQFCLPWLLPGWYPPPPPPSQLSEKNAGGRWLHLSLHVCSSRARFFCWASKKLFLLPSLWLAAKNPVPSCARAPRLSGWVEHAYTFDWLWHLSFKKSCSDWIFLMVTLLITLIQNPKPSKFTLGMVIHPKLMPFSKCLLLGAITQNNQKLPIIVLFFEI